VYVIEMYLKCNCNYTSFSKCI